MDYRNDIDNSVDPGAGEQLHDGRFDSYPVGNCYYRDSDQRYSGTQRIACWRGYQPIQGDNQKEGAK